MIAIDRTLKALISLSLARQAEFGPATQRVYEHVLRDTSPELVARACERLSSEPREAFEHAMPEAGRIKSLAEQIAQEDRLETKRQRLLPAPSDDDPRTWRHCNACDDTSWEEFFCLADGSRPQPDYLRHVRTRDCGRSRPHAPHTFVIRCDCTERNPVIAKRRENETRVIPFKAKGKH